MRVYIYPSLLALVCAGLVLESCPTIAAQAGLDVKTDTIASRFPPPPEFNRIALPKNSFGYWLRNLTLKPGRPPVLLYNGQKKTNQTAHVAVVNIDVGNRDLQQCADAVMRIWAEYLWSNKRQEEVCFRTATGRQAKFALWRRGYRPPKGGIGPWEKTAIAQGGYAAFRAYLNKVFDVANSASLKQQLVPVTAPLMVEPGDVFIQGATSAGYGHAVLVVDVVERQDGKRKILLAQSYMPAQDIHILNNPRNLLSVWYDTTVDGSMVTPEWSFGPGSLRRFKPNRC